MSLPPRRPGRPRIYDRALTPAERMAKWRRRQRPEDAIQKAIFEHLAARAVPGVVAWHTPLGGFRKPAEAAILKGLGTKAGVSDVLAVRPSLCPCCGFGPLPMIHALELKARGRATDAQMEFIHNIRAAGGYGVVAFGLDEALRCLEAWNLLKGKTT